MRNVFRQIGLLSALVVVACSGTSEVAGPSELPECSGPVAVNVSAGTTPTFSWMPACKLYYLDVSAANGSRQMWSLGTNFRNTIAPAVAYGMVPVGATQNQAPVPLVAGTAYRVFVAFALSASGDQFAGEKVFTP